MKKILLIAASVGIVLSLTALFCTAHTLFSGESLKGSGKLITKTMDAPAFHGVKASRAVKVVLTDKVTDKISIEADDNVMEYVVVKTDGGVLHVGIDKKMQSVSNLHVTVTVPTDGKIRSLDASSAANIESKVALTADEFEFDASSAAKIEATVNARKCDMEASSAAQIKATVNAGECDADASSAAKIDAEINATTKCDLSASSAAKIDASVKTPVCHAEGSSASKISVKGNADRCEIDFSSGAKFEGKEFVVGDYNAELSSGSSATVNCNGVLTTNVSSGASVKFTGEPKSFNNRSSSGGHVSRL